jgi:hypothetical protein
MPVLGLEGVIIWALEPAELVIRHLISTTCMTTRIAQSV